MGRLGGSEWALAVCGFSGSGKTTLLETLIPRLVARGLVVGAVKHDAHGIDVDRAGKDSDRLFRAGADVVLRSPAESLVRWHGAQAPTLEGALRHLARRADLVLVEGHKSTSLPKLWLLRQGESAPPPEVTDVIAVLPWSEDRSVKAELIALEAAESSWDRRRVVGGVLMGGRSRRMGRPKHLLTHRGRTLVERAVEVLSAVASEVVLLGANDLPPSLRSHPRLPDPPGAEGPIAGVLGALRWDPEAAWLVVSCDLPLLTEEALRWLVGERRPGRWVVMAHPQGGPVQPLISVYEPQSAHLVEDLVAARRWAPRLLADHDQVYCPSPPPEMMGQWVGVNTPEQYEELCRTERSE